MPGPGMDLIGEEEIVEVVSLLKSGYLLRYGKENTQNFQAKVYTLERKIAELCNVSYAVGVNSGTSALLVGLLGLGVGPGDEVIVPGYTFVASISTVIYAGAVPVLAEIDQTFNLDPADVAKKITKRTKAIMPVHMLGNPARMDEIVEIAKEKDLYLIEDCAQAFGATYKNASVGSMGDVGAFSFNGHKTITAGDGGMLVTDDKRLYERCFAIHDQGHFPNRCGVEIGSRTVVGLDLRLTELQAAVLLAQLGKFELISEKLRANKALYKSLIEDLPGISFREITDPMGESSTLLVVILPTSEMAVKVAAELGSKVLSDSGWHVYSHMEHVLNQSAVTEKHSPWKHPSYLEKGGDVSYEIGMLPKTDNLLSRAINISIGVWDPGLGSGFGVTVKDSEEEIKRSAAKFRRAYLKYL
jgi:dTDP-4-amino-4,6-dideoxygalactose transaminase